MVKHISLDFWNTIMVSNKKFSQLRVTHILKEYLPNITIDELNFKIEKIGADSDKINMSQGISIPSEVMYQRVLSEFEIKINTAQAKQIYHNLEKIFLKNPPIPLYNLVEFKNCLQILKAKGFTLNISSNTAYIKGNTLKKVFKYYNLLDYFDFLIFSDEINSSKPAPKFFEKLEEECKKICIPKNNIIHIGDSLEADVVGAESFKIKSRLIDYKKENLIKLLMDFTN